MENDEKKNAFKEYFDFSDVLAYFFRKSDPNRKTNFSLKVMHGINRLAMIMFLIALIILLIRHLT